MTRAASANSPRARAAVGGYLDESASPLTSLVFLLPLIAVYEIGTGHFTTAAQQGRDEQIIAFTMMEHLFHLFGVHGRHLPALAVATILLSWHVAHNRPWTFRLSTLGGMLVEAVLLALPLMAIARQIARHFSLSATFGSRVDTVVMSVGAGVYEELVFRLILLTVLSLLFRDLLRIHPGWSCLGMVLISGFAFSAYHYLSPVEVFHWRSFIFRTVAGAYFALLFMLRGFGVAAGAHAAYDILILFL